MRCPTCGHPMFRMPFTVIDLEDGREYIVYRCTNCGDEVLVPKRCRMCGRANKNPSLN